MDDIFEEKKIVKVIFVIFFFKSRMCSFMHKTYFISFLSAQFSFYINQNVGSLKRMMLQDYQQHILCLMVLFYFVKMNPDFFFFFLRERFHIFFNLLHTRRGKKCPQIFQVIDKKADRFSKRNAVIIIACCCEMYYNASQILQH